MGKRAGTRPRQPTSRDVAELAGVSQTTVSLVINDAAHVVIPDETRARVRRAIAQLDYHPNEAARILGRRATRDIGVIVPEASNPHYLDIVAGVRAYAEGQGYGISLSITDFDLQRERRCLSWLKQQRSDALIVSLAHGPALLDELRALRRQGYAITTLGFSDETMDSVGTGGWTGERQLMEHLIALGHRRLGYIYGAFNHETYGDRLAACLNIQHELGLPVVEAWVRRCGPTQDEGYRETHALLAACPADDRLTALVVVNDYLAIGVLAALHEAGIAVPRAISVASFDNTYLSRYTTPALTTVDLGARVMGEQAARMTVERLSALDAPAIHWSTPTRLVARSSTGPALAER